MHADSAKMGLDPDAAFTDIGHAVGPIQGS